MAGRAELMDEINEVSFALNETTLYLDTVSYTHLDVYKRQSCRLP